MGLLLIPREEERGLGLAEHQNGDLELVDMAEDREKLRAVDRESFHLDLREDNESDEPG